MGRQGNCCIYCKSTNHSQLSKGHIFPKVIGGRVSRRFVCQNCNSIIGANFESQIKKCLFFVFGIDKFNKHLKDKTFKEIDIEDDLTKGSLKFNDNELIGRNKVIENNDIVRGTKEFVEDHTLRWIEKNRPNWVEFYKKELAKGNKIINIAGDKFIRDDGSKSRIVNYIGKVLFPKEILAKISYELMYGFGLPSNDLLKDFLGKTFKIIKNNKNVEDVQVIESFYKRIGSPNSNKIILNSDDFSILNYQPFHRVVFRVSDKNVFYLKVTFYELLSFIIPIGVCEINQINQENLNVRFVFSINESKIMGDPEENYDSQLREHEDILANVLWNVYNN